MQSSVTNIRGEESTVADAGTQYENGCCDNGWIHLCGGPHGNELVERTDPTTGETEYVSVVAEGHVPMRPASEGGCQTVRCQTHCSCFGPDGVHDTDCALATEG